MNATIVPVELGDRSYEVSVGADLLATVGSAVADLPNVSRAIVISDETVSALYGEKLLDSLREVSLPATLLTFPSGERNKTLDTVGALLDGALRIEPPIDRDSVVVALGGGVCGDVAGFVAATLLRGVRWVQCPTTLLADVDASVGGKTGVDHPTGKNLIGAFHQPSSVIIDVQTLATLEESDLRGGLAECVKHAVIRDADLLNFIAESVDAIGRRDPAVMIELIAWNVAIKAAVVSADERETSQRAHLNFGHTVGHAIETTLGFGAISHGEAVALGMVAANELSLARGLIDLPAANRLRSTLKLLGLPVRRDGLDVDKIWSAMQHDKKNRRGVLRMVLCTGLGKVEIFDDVTEPQVRAAVTLLSM